MPKMQPSVGLIIRQKKNQLTKLTDEGLVTSYLEQETKCIVEKTRNVKSLKLRQMIGKVK
jgi:hypothetical protein